MRGNQKPRLRTARFEVLLTETEHMKLLRLSAQTKLKRSELIRRALFEYARQVAA